jgi:U4/U6.U5 tri-snRNP-associated protein 2
MSFPSFTDLHLNNLSHLTVLQLKHYLHELQLSCSGLKAVLVGRLKAALVDKSDAPQNNNSQPSLSNKRKLEDTNEPQEKHDSLHLDKKVRPEEVSHAAVAAAAAAAAHHDDDDDRDDDTDVGRNSISFSEYNFSSAECPYLDTINRRLLDFDYEFQCSVTLATLNIYCCLVCGKNFAGRENNSPAYNHSIQADHHVFIHLANKTVYCIPDNYIVNNSTFDDIIYNVSPTYNQNQIRKLHENTHPVQALDGHNYWPGFMGLNQIKHNDWFNVLMQLVMRVEPLRDYFLLRNIELKPQKLNTSHNLIEPFTQLLRRCCNFSAFKSHISPALLLKSIAIKSNQLFSMEKSCDLLAFIAWFFSELSRELSKTKEPPIIQQCFQGEVEISETKLTDTQNPTAPAVTTKPFYYLSLALPPVPLFKQSTGDYHIPQISIYQLLNKFTGENSETIENHDNSAISRTYRITKLPRYLLIHIQRFSKNDFFMEKNPTLVQFPLNQLDCAALFKTNINKHYLNTLNTNQLLQLAKDKRVDTKGVVEKVELIELLLPRTNYNLIGNIVHDGPVAGGKYRVYLLNSANSNWFELEDLHVSSPATAEDQRTLVELIAVSQAYILLYQLQS